MAAKKGKGSATARKANAKAAKEGKSNPRKSSAAQAELGKKGAKKKKKKKKKKRSLLGSSHRQFRYRLRICAGDVCGRLEYTARAIARTVAEEIHHDHPGQVRIGRAQQRPSGHWASGHWEPLRRRLPAQ